VKLGLAIRESAQLCYEGATLIIDGAVMPIDVELALWRFLRSKYERGVDKREIDVTTLESTARERALWFR
jgi:hypothetical protein